MYARELSCSVAHVTCNCCLVTESCSTFATPWTAAHQASLSFAISQGLLKFLSVESVILSISSSSPSTFSLPKNQGFSNASGGQSIGISASASVLPTNIQC